MSFLPGPLNLTMAGPRGRQAPCGEWGLGLGLHPLFPSLHLSSLSQSRARDTSRPSPLPSCSAGGPGGGGEGQAFSVAESFRTPFQSRTLSQHLGRRRGKQGPGLALRGPSPGQVSRASLWGRWGEHWREVGHQRVALAGAGCQWVTGSWRPASSQGQSPGSRLTPLLSAQGGVGRPPSHVQGALSG